MTAASSMRAQGNLVPGIELRTAKEEEDEKEPPRSFLLS